MQAVTVQLVIAVVTGCLTLAGIVLAAQQPNQRRLWLPRMVIIVFCVAVAGLVILTFQAVDAQALRDDEQHIRSVILQGTAAELDWYKHPNEDREKSLERYFAPAASGGDRLRQISDVVQNLYRARNRRLADSATRALFINKLEVEPDRATAFAETSEIWYQPLLEIGNSGQEQRVQLTPEQENLYTQVQFYILEKNSGNWLIQSNPAPVGP
jgi:hypothetical protein